VSGKKREVVTISIEVDPVTAKLLTVLAGSPEAALLSLADHAQQGVYRPGAWEREWIEQAFGTNWHLKLVSGDPYGRPDCERYFCKPKEAA